MDSDTMVMLNNIYIKVLKTGKKICDKSENNVNLKSAQYLESYSSYLGEMNEKIKSMMELNDKYAQECLRKANEIRKNIDLDKKHTEPYALSLYTNISWAEIAEMDDESTKIKDSVADAIQKPTNVNDYVHKPVMYKSLSSIYGKPIGFECKIPIINNLNEMQPSMYWFNGSDVNPPGIYTCLTKGFFIQVPFPNVIDSTQDYNRTGSIKCKYNTIKDCLDVRKELAAKFNSDLRDCKFAHKGDKFVKIGTQFRCQKPRFGNHNYLKDDIASAQETDIKSILMYALSDVLLSSLWFQKQGDANKILINIDTC